MIGHRNRRHLPFGGYLGNIFYSGRAIEQAVHGVAVQMDKVRGFHQHAPVNGDVGGGGISDKKEIEEKKKNGRDVCDF